MNREDLNRHLSKSFPSNAAAALGSEHVPDVPPHSHARTRGGRQEEAAALTHYGVCKNMMAI